MNSAQDTLLRLSMRGRPSSTHLWNGQLLAAGEMLMEAAGGSRCPRAGPGPGGTPTGAALPSRALLSSPCRWGIVHEARATRAVWNDDVNSETGRHHDLLQRLRLPAADGAIPSPVS
jgi:hypothetical protein